MKYESSITYHSKVMANIKVFTEKETDRAKAICPYLSMRRHKITMTVICPCCIGSPTEMNSLSKVEVSSVITKILSNINSFQMLMMPTQMTKLGLYDNAFIYSSKIAKLIKRCNIHRYNNVCKITYYILTLRLPNKPIRHFCPRN